MQNTFSTPNYFHDIANKNLSRDTMKAPIAFMLGVLLGNVACLPKDVAKPAQMTQMAKSAQKTETEELSRERRWARSASNDRINSLDIFSFWFSRAVGGVRKRQSGSSNTAADCNFSKGIKVGSLDLLLRKLLLTHLSRLRCACGTTWATQQTSIGRLPLGR